MHACAFYCNLNILICLEPGMFEKIKIVQNWLETHLCIYVVGIESQLSIKLCASFDQPIISFFFKYICKHERTYGFFIFNTHTLVASYTVYRVWVINVLCARPIFIKPHECARALSTIASFGGWLQLRNHRTNRVKYCPHRRLCCDLLFTNGACVL